MEACVLHGAHDLRLEQQDDPGLAPGEVRIRVRNGGICGSDLHYYHQGRVGDFVIREPLVPGHEFSGEVAEVGAGVTGVRKGDRVAVHPGRSCGRCVRCREGRRNLCQNVFFMGSASKFPHMQGGFRERVVVREEQCFPVAAGDAGFDELAFAEPLAVCLHAGLRAGNLAGRSVLVTGGGPIGQLLAMVARHGGAGHVALTDIVAAPLAMARRIGADEALDVSDPATLTEAASRLGGFDVALEASGSPAALNNAIDAVRPGGVIVQVGSLPAGQSPVTANRIMAKELDVRGSFRFDAAFGTAVRSIETRRIDVRPLLTGVMPAADARAAFDIAGDRSRSIKVQIAF